MIIDREELELMIKDCKRRAHKLNEWEISFIEKLYDLVFEKGIWQLTENQKAKLIKVWDKATS
jgi:hypothetical protein